MNPATLFQLTAGIGWTAPETRVSVGPSPPLREIYELQR